MHSITDCPPCPCSYRRDIWVLPKNEIKTISDIGYGVASVFTPKKYRGKGYATHMMSLLHFAIANPRGIPLFPSGWGSKPVAVEQPGIVSILYSDVGSFYGRCSPGEGTGWTITSPVTTEWAIDEKEVISCPDKIELLSRDEAARTAAADATLFKRDLESKGPSPRIHFAFQPTEAWCRFQMTRYDEHPLYVPPLPTTWGVRMRFQGETHFIVWEYEASPERKLTIISIRATRETFPDLFTAVKYVCQTEKHLKIEAWGLGEELSSIAQSSGGRTYERSKSLPAMKWYGEPDQAIWFGNHK